MIRLSRRGHRPVADKSSTWARTRAGALYLPGRLHPRGADRDPARHPGRAWTTTSCSTTRWPNAPRAASAPCREERYRVLWDNLPIWFKMRYVREILRGARAAPWWPPPTPTAGAGSRTSPSIQTSDAHRGAGGLLPQHLHQLRLRAAHPLPGAADRRVRA
ncbi:MAG: hypothetical protein MZU95_00340 [Desulfomicrobium escambiense]|nr:hypothetical protein [Desulfomicrobium escambiense]